jgi:hypothetical protein
MSKGQLIATVLLFVLGFSLNHKTMSVFFKIKRQRLARNNYFNESNVKIGKLSNLKLIKKRRLRDRNKLH